MRVLALPAGQLYPSPTITTASLPAPLQKGWAKRLANEKIGSFGIVSSLKLFISHSSKKPKNERALNRICDALRQVGGGESYEILMDREGILPDEEWYRRIDEWMAECHAAVILFSEAALHDSMWVRKEAAILSWRRRMQPGFKLIGVLLEGLTAEQLDTELFYNVIRITDFQQISCDSIDQVVQEVRSVLDPIYPASTPFDGLVDKLGIILKNYHADALESARQTLEADDRPIWQPGSDPADTIARALFRDPGGALTMLKALFEALGHVLKQADALSMLKLLMGTWVKPDAAASLALARDLGTPAAINGKRVEDFTGCSYIRRVWAFPKNYYIAKAGADWTMETLYSRLLENFQIRANPRQREDLERQLRDCDDPIFLVFPFPETSADYPDWGLLEDLRETCPNVTVLLSLGEAEPEALGEVQTAQPLLEPGHELTQMDRHDDIHRYIERNLQG